MVVTVPVLREYGGNFVLAVALLEGFGVGDIIVVSYTAVLRSFLMAGVEEEMEVVLVADIRAEHGSVEMGDSLIAEIASGVSIVEVEADVYAFAGIHGKDRIDMIFAVGLVAAVVVEHPGIGRECVHKEKLLRTFLHEAIRLGEDEGVALRTVDEDAAHAGRIVATSMVELTIYATIEGGVHKQVRQRVGLSGDNVAELPVDIPGIDTFRNLLVSGGIVIVLVEVLVALGDIAHLVDLVEGILGIDGRQGQQRENEQTQSFNHSVI